MLEHLLSRTASDANSTARPEVATPRVLAVVPGDANGSSFIFAKRQIWDVALAGMDVQIFYVAERTSLKGLIREWRKLRHEVRQFRPDIVHAHYGTVTAFLCACVSTARLVITYRGSDLNGCPGMGVFRKYMGLLLSQLGAFQADAIICVSSSLADKLWWGGHKLSIIPSGVDMEMFCPADRIRSRKLLGWNDHERIVLFNAGGEPELKGLALAKQALREAERVVGPIRLVVLDGAAAPENVPTYINAADCVLLCSISEGSPNIVKEALACNVPVVAVEVGDVRDLLAGVFPSAVTNERGAASVGNALADVLRIGTRCNGRKIVARISQERITKAVCAVYEGLLVGRK